eukprot:jgi/Psemu1/284090/fgenesh1_pg.42_\
MIPKFEKGGATAEKDTICHTNPGFRKNMSQRRRVSEGASSELKRTTANHEGEGAWNAEDSRSVFSRLKCRNTAEICDEKPRRDPRSSFENSSKSVSSTRVVHQMLTPWLVVERENKRSVRNNSTRGENDSYATRKQMETESSAASNTARKEGTAENNINDKTSAVEYLTSDQDPRSRVDDTKAVKKQQNKHSIGSKLFGRRHSAPDHCNATKSCPSSEEQDSGLHHLYRIFPHDQSGDPASGDIEQIKDQNRSLEDDSTTCRKLKDPPAFHERAVVGEERYEPILDYSYDDGFYCDGTNSIVVSQEDSELRTMKTSSNVATVSKFGSSTNDFGYIARDAAGKKFSERDITTPRRRNSRSPSPLKLRRQSDLSNPSDFSQNGKVERQQRNDANREMLMGLEMHRQLDQISSSFECGTVQSKSREPSLSESQMEAPPEQNSRLSIFSASTMSCLNPTSQLTSYDKARSAPYNENVCEENNQNILNSDAMNPSGSKPTTNDFWSSASSALLLDVRDDDPLWKYYEKKERANLPLQDQTSIEYERLAREDSPHMLPPSNTDVNGSIYSPEERRTCARTFDDSSRVSSSVASRFNEVITSESTMRRSAQAISVEMPFSETEMYVHPNRNQPNIQRYRQESVQPSKKELLDQMRDAVKMASAELDSRQRLQVLKPNFGDRYDTIKHDTSVRSNGSTPASDHSQRNEQLFTPVPMNSPTRTNDKYDFH